jgi:predicted ATP-grasp superfamily ATP-dependent carboligase
MGEILKTLSLFNLLFVLQFVSLEAHAISVHGEFKIEAVKPWGEFGFRALGRGKNVAEMRFDCSRASQMGLVLSVVNNYGKTSNVVMPTGKLGTDKYKCQANLKQYFASISANRGLASFKNKDHQPRSIELSFIQNKKKLSFR